MRKPIELTITNGNHPFVVQDKTLTIYLVVISGTTYLVGDEECHAATNKQSQIDESDPGPIGICVTESLTDPTGGFR